jgi:transcriptional regulator with XRE-family HTH domain
MAPHPSDDAGYAIVLGKVIAHLRERAGLTQARLAELVAVPQSRLSRIEAGTMPDALTLNRIAAALGVTVDRLHVLTTQGLVRMKSTAAQATGRASGPDWGALLALVGVTALAGLAVFVVATLFEDEDHPR